MASQVLETVIILAFGLSALIFFGCIGLWAIRGRFGLRTLAIAVAAACVVCAILSTTGNPWEALELAD